MELPAPNGTRDKLIDAAEQLFAQHGIEAVSLRSIGLAAGQANKVVVQYHFSDKRSLVAAILEKRAPAIEAAIALHAARTVTENAEVRTILSALFMPLVDTPGDEPNAHVRFLLNLLCSSKYWLVSNVSLARLIFGLEPEGQSETTKLVRLLDRRLPNVPVAVLRERLPHLLRMLLGAIVHRENTLAAGYTVWPKHRLLADQLDMIAAALERTSGRV